MTRGWAQPWPATGERPPVSGVEVSAVEVSGVEVSAGDVVGFRRRARWLGLVTILWALVGAAGCNDSFDPPSLVNHLRLVALQADPPWVGLGPAERSVLRPKVVGVATGAPLCHAYGLCLTTASKDGSFGCLDERMLVDLGVEATAAVDGGDVLAALAGAQRWAAEQGLSRDGAKPPSADGSGPALNVQVLVGVAEAAAFPSGCPAGIEAWLAAGCQDRDRCVIGTKTLRVATGDSDRHNNPTLDDLLVGGHSTAAQAPPDFSPGEIALTPVWAPGSLEPIAADAASGPVKESLTFSWFSTAGTFDQQRSYDAEPDNVLTLKASDDVVDVVVVARDGRGGVVWREARLRLQ